jgi:hypothetical protein
MRDGQKKSVGGRKGRKKGKGERRGRRRGGGRRGRVIGRLGTDSRLEELPCISFNIDVVPIEQFLFKARGLTSR